MRVTPLSYEHEEASETLGAGSTTTLRSSAARFRRSCRREVLALDRSTSSRPNASEAACVDSKCPARTRRLGPTATQARRLPTRVVSRRNGAARAVCCVRVAAQAAWVRAPRPDTCPVRVWPARCWPADGWVPGHRPAHAARWRAGGKHVMSVPIADTTGAATRAPTPGRVWRRATAWGSTGAGLSCSGRGRSVVVRVIASASRGGLTLALSRPWRRRAHIQAQARPSVFRPGTALRGWALTNRTVQGSSRSLQTGRHEPVSPWHASRRHGRDGPHRWRAFDAEASHDRLGRHLETAAARIQHCQAVSPVRVRSRRTNRPESRMRAHLTWHPWVGPHGFARSGLSAGFWHPVESDLRSPRTG